MKKTIVLLVLLLAMTVCAFAQNYTVQTVTGRVQQEKSGSRIDVKVGDTITAETIVYTGVGASLVIKEDDKTFTISAAKSGKVSELAFAGGVKISGNIAKTDTAAVNRTTAQASTASARASEAAAGADIAAE